MQRDVAFCVIDQHEIDEAAEFSFTEMNANE